MKQTVIAMFDNPAEAKQAAQQLTSSGLLRENIDITTKQAAPASTAGGPDTKEEGDGISRFFHSLLESEEAGAYTEVAYGCNSIVTVHAQSEEEARRAARILDEAGAVDSDGRAARSGYSGQGGRTSAEGDTTVPVLEERMQVGKREVETGGVRLRSRIVERPVEEHLRLRREYVWVERVRVDRPATEEDFANFQEGEIELRAGAEVPVVNKEAMVVEEINLSKEVEEHDEAIRGTVRNTDVDIENLSEEEPGRRRTDGDGTRNS